MYNNSSHLMISGCLISVLCIKMERRHSQIKPEGRDELLRQNTRICFICGGEYQTAASAVRWSRGYIGGLCRGQWGGLPPAECFYEVLLLALVLYGKLSWRTRSSCGKSRWNCGETIISCFSLGVFTERIAPSDSNWFWSVTRRRMHKRINCTNYDERRLCLCGKDNTSLWHENLKSFLMEGCRMQLRDVPGPLKQTDIVKNTCFFHMVDVWLSLPVALQLACPPHEIQSYTVKKMMDEWMDIWWFLKKIPGTAQVAGAH